jgi:hypothetical protein
MIIPDKKKAVTVILSKLGKGPGPEVKPEAGLDEHHEAMKSIAEDIMQAFEDKSAMDLANALEALVREIQAMDEEQDASDME